MATFYSDHFTTTGISQTTRGNTFAATGKGISRSFKVMAKATALPTTSDVLRLFSIPSSARMPALMISDNNASAAGAMNIGLYKSEGLGGAVIDADLFAAALAKNTAQTDCLTQATNVTNVKRDLYLWEMAAITVATITKDPQEIWDVCLTPSTSFTTTASIFLIEAQIILGS
jgi:hypothetical protein